MIIESEVTRKIHIELDEKEARYLMGFLQNYPGERFEEPEKDYVIRRELFDGLYHHLENRVKE